MENRIKECQLDLYADRTSAATMRANQLRLWFAAIACVLVCALRRIGLAETIFAAATCGTIRLRLLKIGRWSASPSAASGSLWRQLVQPPPNGGLPLAAWPTPPSPCRASLTFPCREPATIHRPMETSTATSQQRLRRHDPVLPSANGTAQSLGSRQNLFVV